MFIQRGLRGVKYITSDDHAGLKAACKAMFPGVPWQCCQFHLQHNAQGYVSKLDQRTPVARQIRAIFNASDAHEAQRLLNVALKQYQVSHPQLAAWAEINLTEGFAVFGLPEAHRVRLCTTNGLERLNKELKRRTRVATLFPNIDSCKRLVSAFAGCTRQGVNDRKNLPEHENLIRRFCATTQNKNQNLQDRCCFISGCATKPHCMN